MFAKGLSVYLLLFDTEHTDIIINTQIMCTEKNKLIFWYNTFFFSFKG